MATKGKTETVEQKGTQKEKYLNDVFTILKNVMSLSTPDKKTYFNSTEIRLLGEVLSAKYIGKRLISTQLAKALGVTRSAISQMVNRLEAQNILMRVPDEVDRKIAYIEVTENALKTYGEDLKVYIDFISRVVERFGVENFETMCKLFNEFYATVQEEKSDFVGKRKYTKAKKE